MLEKPTVDFVSFRKIPRYSREVIVSEKIDGSNGQILITEEGTIHAGSRNRWLGGGEKDNFSFAAWVEANKDELMLLGPGLHFGEWWGAGIQRTYGLKEKRFSLFNVSRWNDPVSRPSCCGVVPTLYTGPHDTNIIQGIVDKLKNEGSVAVPGFMNPEGVVVYHTAGGHYYKKTCTNDEKPKGAPEDTM